MDRKSAIWASEIGVILVLKRRHGVMTEILRLGEHQAKGNP